jgi:hypothetical protein
MIAFRRHLCKQLYGRGDCDSPLAGPLSGMRKWQKGNRSDSIALSRGLLTSIERLGWFVAMCGRVCIRPSLLNQEPEDGRNERT